MDSIDGSDALSHKTARILISEMDSERDMRHPIREMLAESCLPSTMIDLAIMEDLAIAEDNILALISKTSENLDAIGEFPGLYHGHSNQQKRRRSSTQASPVKPVKLHKKKLQKANSALQVRFDPHDKNSRIPFKKVRDFVHASLSPSPVKEKLFKIINQNKVQQVVVCFAGGILPTNLLPASGSSSFPKLSANMSKHFLSQLPGSKEALYLPLQGITAIPLTRKERNDLTESLKATKITITDLLMSSDQLVQNGYPQRGEGWQQTVAFEHPGLTIFGLDCEFCRAESGHVLTRISLVNFDQQVVFDLLVKPDQEILDYATKYSGITAEILQGVDTTLAQVQKLILETVSCSDILVGHSLESDLGVLKIVHERVVDTLVIFEHVRGPPAKPSLKYLAQKYLNREIQSGERDGLGHSLVQDAQTCIDLVKMKISEGMLFGTNYNEISIFKRLYQDGQSKLLWIKHLPNIREDVEDSDGVFRAFAANDDQVVSKYTEHQKGRKFVLLSLKDLEYALKWESPCVSSQSVTENVVPPPSLDKPSSQARNSLNPETPIEITTQSSEEVTESASTLTLTTKFSENLNNIQAQSDSQLVTEPPQPLTDIEQHNEIQPQADIQPQIEIRPQNDIQPHTDKQCLTDTPPPTDTPLTEIFAKIDTNLDEIYKHMPQDSIMVVYSAVGDPREVYRLQNVKRAFHRYEREGKDLSTLSPEEIWDFNKQVALATAISAARESLTCICVKSSSPH